MSKKPSKKSSKFQNHEKSEFWRTGNYLNSTRFQGKILTPNSLRELIKKKLPEIFQKSSENASFHTSFHTNIPDSMILAHDRKSPRSADSHHPTTIQKVCQPRVPGRAIRAKQSYSCKVDIQLSADVY